MESKYLIFDKYVRTDRKTPVYEIKNKKTLDSLGVIYFYPPWRRYVFESNLNIINPIIYDVACLTDISNFMQEIQTEWRNSLKAGKSNV